MVDIIRANVRLPTMSHRRPKRRRRRRAHRRAERLGGIVDRYGLDADKETFEAILDHGEMIAPRALSAHPDRRLSRRPTSIDGDGITDDPIPIRVTRHRHLGEASLPTSPDARRKPEVRSTAPAARSCPPARPSSRRSRRRRRPRMKDSSRRLRSLLRKARFSRRSVPLRPAGTSKPPPTRPSWSGRRWPRSCPSGSPPGRTSRSAPTTSAARGRTAAYWVLATPQDGGWGACVDQDGESALIATTDGDTYNYPAEVIETRFRWPCCATRSMSRRAAARAVPRRVRHDPRVSRPESDAAAFCSPRSAAPYSGHGAVDGGQQGTSNYFEVIRAGRRTDPRRPCHQPAACGRRLVRIVTGNGGGWGDPHERERDLILEDVRDEYITPDVAREVYGVDVDLSANRECV